MQCTIIKIKKEQYVQIYLTKEELKAQETQEKIQVRNICSRSRELSRNSQKNNYKTSGINGRCMLIYRT